MLELINEKEGYFYFKNREEEFLFSKFIRYDVVYEEIIQSTKIKTINILDFYDSICFEELPYDIHNFKYLCIHKNKINYNSINRLPSCYWEELIECWSCHNNEFNSLKDLKIKPRKNGILISSLNILLFDNILPECCRDGLEKTRKIYFNNLCIVNKQIGDYKNDVDDGYKIIDDMYFVYHYLVEYFKLNSTYVYKYRENTFEIKYLHKSLICMKEESNIKKYNCIKVGIKKSNRIVNPDKNVNRYFSDLIHENIILIGIQGLGYEFGFIVKKIYR